jgi:hypothetical protein
MILGRASSVIVSPTKVTKNHIDPSLFRSSFTSQKSYHPLSLVKSEGCHIFSQVLNIDQHSYQRFFQNCITSNRMFLLTFYINFILFTT